MEDIGMTKDRKRRLADTAPNENADAAEQVRRAARHEYTYRYGLLLAIILIWIVGYGLYRLLA